MPAEEADLAIQNGGVENTQTSNYRRRTHRRLFFVVRHECVRSEQHTHRVTVRKDGPSLDNKSETGPSLILPCDGHQSQGCATLKVRTSYAGTSRSRNRGARIAASDSRAADSICHAG